MSQIRAAKAGSQPVFFSRQPLGKQPKAKELIQMQEILIII